MARTHNRGKIQLARWLRSTSSTTLPAPRLGSLHRRCTGQSQHQAAVNTTLSWIIIRKKAIKRPSSLDLQWRSCRTYRSLMATSSTPRTPTGLPSPSQTRKTNTRPYLLTIRPRPAGLGEPKQSPCRIIILISTGPQESSSKAI